MIAHFLISLSVPATTIVAALLWAKFVANGMIHPSDADGAERGQDIRTW
jgi:hypothetical protein